MERKGAHAPLHYGKHRFDAPLHNLHVRGSRELLRDQERGLVRNPDGPLMRFDWIWIGWFLSWANRQACEYDLAAELGHLCSHEHSPRRGRKGIRED